MVARESILVVDVEQAVVGKVQVFVVAQEGILVAGFENLVVAAQEWDVVV